jgi:hypothetical protein
MSDAEGIFCRFASPDGSAGVVIEDDGRVCYVYWVDAAGSIGGDVWLYNRGPAPGRPARNRRDDAPFLNPAEFVDQDVQFALPSSAADFRVEWSLEKGQWMAAIWVGGQVLAKLMHGNKPGWSRLAAKDGPLARVLRD